MLEIREVTRYQARYTTQSGKIRIAEYARKSSLCKKIAWWVIIDRYGFGKGNMLSDSLRGFECDCRDTGEGIDSTPCPLHNRNDGYYKRLHERVSRWLAKGYIKLEET